MPGYSGTPLWKKLGYKPGIVAYVEGADAAYRDQLALPAEVVPEWAGKATARTRLVHLFVTSLAALQARLGELRPTVPADGMIWVSWPKKAAKVPTDITEDRIRECALPLGFVDVKVCAVDDVWSGLKLVLRKELRGDA